MKRKKKKKGYHLKPRLPMEAVDRLGNGGFHSTKSGKKGYDRKEQKYNPNKDYDNE